MVGLSLILIVLAVILGSVLYFLPSIIGASRGVPNLGIVIVLNIFLGWTFVGWVVAFAMAFASTAPRVVVAQGYYGPPPGYYPPPGPQQWTPRPDPLALPPGGQHGSYDNQWADPRYGEQPRDPWR